MMGRVWTYLKETPTWVWLALFVVSLVITTHALRQNNLEMVRLKNALYAADQSGRGVDQALNNLRGYVYGHMNTDLNSSTNAIKPPIQLKYTYDRLVKTEQERVNQANDQILRDAASYCAVHQPGRYRQVCVESYNRQHEVKVPQPVPPALYQFDFASPAWSPDLAGWSLVASVLLGLTFVVSLIADQLAAFRLRHHRRKA